MSAVYLTSGVHSAGNTWLEYPCHRFLESAKADIHKEHHITDDPDDADIIIFASNGIYNPCGFGLFFEPVFRKHLSKSFIYSSLDSPPFLWRGLFPSYPKSAAGGGFAVGWNYFHPNSAEPIISTDNFVPAKQLLWSFVGSLSTHPLRKQLLQLDLRSGFLEDTSDISQSSLRDPYSAEAKCFRSKYINILENSKFCICPRGQGSSSMRIFEAMKAGVVPVVISDDWLPPPFVKWDDFCIQVREAEILDLPKLLRNRESEAEERGNIARQEWDRVFGRQSLFHYAVEACLLIQARTDSRLLLRQVVESRRVFYPRNIREIVRWLQLKIKSP
jgi:hypothetical protein